MSETAYTGDFADGEYRFFLALPQAVELERKCGDKSLFAIYDGLAAGIGLDDAGKPIYVGGGNTAMATEIRETIRLGLIGGNSGVVDGVEITVGPQLAKQLVDNYVWPAQPMVEGAYLAWTILHAAINGISLKKKADEPVVAKPRRRSPKAKS